MRSLSDLGSRFGSRPPATSERTGAEALASRPHELLVRGVVLQGLKAPVQERIELRPLVERSLKKLDRTGLVTESGSDTRLMACLPAMFVVSLLARKPLGLT